MYGVLPGQGFEVRFPPGAERIARDLHRIFPGVRTGAARWLGCEERGEPLLLLVADHAEMVRLGGSGAPEWAVAIAKRDDRLIFRLDLLEQSPGTSVRHVAAHEAVHQILGRLGGFPLPRWFEEGLCVHYAGIPFFESDYRLERLAAAGNLPSLADLDEAFAGDSVRAGVGYAAGASLVGEFLARFGDGALRRLLADVAQGRHFEAAFLGASEVRLADFEARWREMKTPGVPLWLYLMLENLELTLLCVGAFAVVAGYIRWRWRREGALAALEGAGAGASADAVEP